MGMKRSLKNALFQSIHRSHLPRIARRSHGSVGAILALHRVRPPQREAFAPNGNLEITPEFLDQTIQQVRCLGFEIIGLDEMHHRLTSGRSSGRFVCFTLDDGYADNVHHAAPVFEASQAPFAIYATTGFLDRTAIFWWLLLEDIIRRETGVTLRIEGRDEHRRTATYEEKSKAFADFHDRFRNLPAKDCLATAKQFANDYGVDPARLCVDHSMTWDMARAITEGGLGTIEAHTVTHSALSRQEESDIRAEFEQCSSRIEEQTGYRPKHFACPFGDEMAADVREFDILKTLPILTSTTTRPGMLLPAHAEELTALPRLTLNGLYQSAGYVDVLLSGIGVFISRSIETLNSRPRLGEPRQ